MKGVLLLFIAMVSLTATKAEDKKKPAAPTAAKQIEWLSFEEAEKRMQKEPRKVWIDVYTEWCGWCKVLDKKVFTNPELIAYMNKKFYAIKFDAERKDSIAFMGKKWGFVPESRANMLAVQLLNGQLSYPTSVIMTENFQNPSAVPGYHAVPEMESFMKYLGDDTYKTVKFEDYMKTFQPKWKELEPSAPQAAKGH